MPNHVAGFAKIYNTKALNETEFSAMLFEKSQLGEDMG